MTIIDSMDKKNDCDNESIYSHLYDSNKSI